MKYLDVEKQEFFIFARQRVTTVQYTFHGHLEIFLVIKLQFYFHFVSEHQTTSTELQSC